MAAGVALAVAFARGGFYLSHSRRAESIASNASAAPAPVPASAPAPAVAAVSSPLVAPAANAVPAQPAKISKAAAVSAAKPPAVEPKTSAVEAKPSAPVVSEQSAAASVSAPAPTPVSSATHVRDVTSDLFGSLNAHPVAGRRESESAQAAPSIEATPAVSGAAAPSFPGSASSGPVSPFPNLRLRTGPAVVKEPRLLSSEVPNYPAGAKQTHIEGDVLIDTVIDQTGKVSDMQVLSGPQILRQPALDALRHWKYQPSTLDGQPVPAKLTVRIKFRL